MVDLRSAPVKNPAATCLIRLLGYLMNGALKGEQIVFNNSLITIPAAANRKK